MVPFWYSETAERLTFIIILSLLVELAVLLTELVNSTGRIHELCFTRVEWVRLVADFHLDQWVLVSVFPLDGFFGCGSRTAQECVVV